MTAIVTVLVQQQIAPTPPTLQQSGAIISQGATTAAPGSYLLLTQLSDLTPHLTGSHPLTTLVWSGGTVTATAVSPHGLPIGDTPIYVNVAGAAPAGYNGTWAVTVTSVTQFTYQLSINPGTMTAPGIYTLDDVNELLQQTTDFFSQGYQVAVYVLELGVGSPTEGVTALNAYITENPNSEYTPGAQGYFYSYLVPRTWDGNAAFLGLLPTLSGNTAETYFHITTTLATWPMYSDLWKNAITYIEAYPTGVWPANALTSATWSNSSGVGVVTFDTTTAHGVAVGQWFQITGTTPMAYNGWYQAQVGTQSNVLVASLAANPGSSVSLGSLVPSVIAYPGIGVQEFSAASAWWVTLSWNPSSANRVPPWAFSFVTDTTPFPTRNNSSLLSTLKQNFVNIYQTANEGGISNVALFWGTTMSGVSFNYWYSVDWFVINSKIAIANAVINGSNTMIAPLYFNQEGINRLQAEIVQVAKSGVTFGLGAGQVVSTSLDGPSFAAAVANGDFAGQIVVNAVPFVPYLTASPSDYGQQVYKGFSCQWIPQLGFTGIVFDVVVTDFVAP